MGRRRESKATRWPETRTLGEQQSYMQRQETQGALGISEGKIRVGFEKARGGDTAQDSYETFHCCSKERKAKWEKVACLGSTSQ